MTEPQIPNAENISTLLILFKIVKGTISKLGLTIADENKQDTQIFNRIITACSDKQ